MQEYSLVNTEKISQVNTMAGDAAAPYTAK